MSDESRKKILARRASFVAAALAGVACQKEPAEKPQPCLSVAVNYNPDAAAPEPCLSVSLPDSNLDAGAPADASPPQPQPCLSVRMPTDAGSPVPKPQPHPCLTPRRPEDSR